LNALLAVGVVVVFAVAVLALGLTQRAREAGMRAKGCLDVLRDPSLDDDAKGRALRRQSLHLFGLSATLIGGTALALLVPLSAVLLMDRAGMASFDAVLAVLGRPDFLAATLAAGIIAGLLVQRARRP
jgi:hypothetical protein